MNTALLTGSSLIMSLISMSFQVWLAGRIGSAGIGLYQLVVSVSFLCTTFAVSGVRFAATRLVSEEIGREREQGISGAMRRCFVYSTLFGTAAFFALRSGAEMIGFLWIGDARTVRSLRIMAYAMPMVSLCSAMSGYFTACGRVWKPTVVHFFEQIITIALVALFLARSPAGDIEKNCSAVMLGTVCGDAISFVMLLMFYLTDRGRHPGGGKTICTLPRACCVLRCRLRFRPMRARRCQHSSICSCRADLNRQAFRPTALCPATERYRAWLCR